VLSIIIEGTASSLKLQKKKPELFSIACYLLIKSAFDVALAMVIGLKCISHKFQQLKSWFQLKAKEAKGKYAKPQVSLQGLVSLFNGKTRTMGVSK